MLLGIYFVRQTDTIEKASHLADERAELTRGETVVGAREDGNADYNVAEKPPQVVEGVDSDWNRANLSTLSRQRQKITGSSAPTVKPKLLVHQALLCLQQRLQSPVGPHVLHFTSSEKTVGLASQLLFDWPLHLETQNELNWLTVIQLKEENNVVDKVLWACNVCILKELTLSELHTGLISSDEIRWHNKAEQTGWSRVRHLKKAADSALTRICMCLNLPEWKNKTKLKTLCQHRCHL